MLCSVHSQLQGFWFQPIITVYKSKPFAGGRVDPEIPCSRYSLILMSYDVKSRV